MILKVWFGKSESLSRGTYITQMIVAGKKIDSMLLKRSVSLIFWTFEMKVIKNLFITVVLIQLQACVQYQSLIPEGYVGDTAKITDSVRRISSSRASLYFVESVSGINVYNAHNATFEGHKGKGPFRLSPVPASRDVVAGEHEIIIVAEIYNAAAIGALVNAGKNYRVVGTVNLVVEGGREYFVRGELGEEYSAVWIENFEGEVVSGVVETTFSEIQPLEVSRNEYIDKKAEELTPNTKREKYFSIKYGESEDVVERKIGKPSGVSVKDGNIFTDRPPFTTYSYEGFGEVVFRGKKPKSLHVEKIVPKPITSPNDVPELERIFKLLNARNLQSLARAYYSEGVSNEKILDVIAGKIWEERNTIDEYVADSMALFCKLMGEINNPRYKNFLKLVAEEAVDKKLRRHALKNYENLLKDEVIVGEKVEQFSVTDNLR